MDHRRISLRHFTLISFFRNEPSILSLLQNPTISRNAQETSRVSVSEVAMHDQIHYFCCRFHLNKPPQDLANIGDATRATGRSTRWTLATFTALGVGLGVGLLAD